MHHEDELLSDGRFIRISEDYQTDLIEHHCSETEDRIRAAQPMTEAERMTLLKVEHAIDQCLAGIQVSTVLDTGTGSGIFAEAFARKGRPVTGIDPNPEMLVLFPILRIVF